jgi:Flp pilus assembly protein TadG
MRRTHNQRGQGLVEAGIIIVLFMAIALGVLTFGHAFMAVNMITHGARDGARLAATWPTRGACNKLDNSNTTAIQTKVQQEIATLVGGTFGVDIRNNPLQSGSTPCATSTTPTVVVTVTGCVPFLFPILPGNLGVDCNGQKGFRVSRVAEFHDEGAPPT